MTQTLLSTKLFIPRARSNLVSRPRLVEQLNTGLHKPLTLISAPAGYGKTTLLSEWRLRFGGDYPIAWLSLDVDDNNLARFLTYVSAALATLDTHLPENLDSLLYLPQLPAVEDLITALINGVSSFPQDFALILDDCHTLTEPAIHAALSYLLDHQPPTMHLVLLTRADPPIPLAKLRVRGDLVELRASDLRFTHQESTTYLNDLMGLSLSGENIYALDERTEGWIAGLQMAALTIQGKEDVSTFIQAFTGSNRYILDFLSEEVIQVQPGQLQDFLLKTSILDRLSGPLCDAVLGGEMNSTQILVDLERKNMFVIPLDDERQWYRYHHLFADLLFQNLRRAEPGSINELYQRAAGWLEDNGFLEDAIGYALKAREYERATRLMNQVRTNLMNHGDIHRLLNWIRILPEDMVRLQPELCFSYSTYLTMTGYFEAAEKWLKLAEAGMGQVATSDLHVSLNEHRFLIYRSIYARFHGDFTEAVALAQRAAELVPQSMPRDRGAILLFLGQAYLYALETQKAEQALQEAVRANQASGHMEAYLNACHNLAQLRLLQGRLREAGVIYEQAAQAASEHGKPIYAGTEHACLGDLKREWNQLEQAAIEVEKGIELAEAGDHIFFLIDVYLARVRLGIARKEWEIAWSYLDKAEQAAQRYPESVEIPYLHAWRVRVVLAQGNLAEAATWADTISLEDTGYTDFYHEFILLTLARTWLACGKAGQAATLLDRIQAVAENSGRAGIALEACMLHALADQASGDEKHAVEKIIEILSRAEPQGYMRMFIEAGPPMAKLLYKATPQAATGLRDYMGRLLAAYSQEQPEWHASQARATKAAGMVEPLSKREMEVLNLLADGCSNKEIASRLVISIGTVKRHIVHILQKLDAANRTQAVAIARELEIL